ncbi:AMP-dependent synthetase and ligase [Hyaloraphidium curvatum]|nr:AMP-dependent synthetase and ligase [Hyaloraphidium curvatum]
MPLIMYLVVASKCHPACRVNLRPATSPTHGLPTTAKMVVLGGPMPLAEADKLLLGPMGEQMGLKTTRITLPWTQSGPSNRQPPDDDPTVQIFAEAQPSMRALWEWIVATYANNPKDREYIIYRDEATKENVRLTYGQVARMVQQIAHSLVAMGVKKGDRVGIAMRNYPPYIPTWWACATIGAVVVPLNAWLTKPELEWCIKDSGSKVLLIDQERLDRLGGPDGTGLADTAAPNGPVTHFVLVRCRVPPSVVAGIDRVGAKAMPFHHLLDETIPHSLPPADIGPFDDFQILYSSGTTGHPKGVLHSNLQWTQLQIAGGRYGGLRAALRTGMDVPIPGPGELPVPFTWFLPVPLFHLTGLSFSLGSTCGGGKIVYVYKWDAKEGIDIIEDEKVTHFMGVPTMSLQILESPNFSLDKVKTLMSLGYGGAPGPAALRERAKAAFKQDGAGEPSNTYGATECFGGASNSGPDYAAKPDSVGKPVPVHRVEIRDSEGKVLPPGSIGEIWIKSNGVAKGYWNNPKATEASFQRGWYHTGDVGRIDDEGFLYLLDRSKDMLIRGGENVYCAEVEAALVSHPDVMDAAVFGIPHRVLGEEVAACVRLVPGKFGKTTMEELRKHCGDKIARFKVPAFIHLVDEALPATPSGKVLKRELRGVVGELAAKQLGGEFAAKL